MREESAVRKSIAWALLAAALVMLIGAGFKTYRVYDPTIDDFGIPTFLWVSERQMTIDATFHGVDRRDGRLITTYDHLAGPGKRPCPT
jgi:hypothetical protein